MTCEEFGGRLTGAVREHKDDAALRAHRDDCSRCASAWDAEWRLQSALDALADEHLAESTPPRPPSSLYAELERAAAANRRKRAAFAWALGVAAALAVALLWPREVVVPAPAQTPRVVEFLPLAPGALPPSGGQILRVYLPGDAPIYWGLPAAPADQLIPAEVLVGDDGIARGVRFVTADESEFGAVSVD